MVFDRRRELLRQQMGRRSDSIRESGVIAQQFVWGYVGLYIR